METGTTTATPGIYNILSISILQSNFNREVSIDFAKEITNELSVNNITTIEEGDAECFTVTTEVLVTGKQDSGEPAFEHKVIITGTFEKIGEPKLSIENFKKINAPAIMYPFVREHVHSTCLKAGMGNVLLPPVNFTIYKEA